MRNFIFTILGVGLLSCGTGDIKKNYSTGAAEDLESESATELIINEFSPKSKTFNEFGKEADWIELYNSSDSVLEVKGSEWSLTDEAYEPLKYILPDTLIPAGGYLLIWCDEEETSERGMLHADFKLSGKGETIYLFKNEVLVDEISYDDDVKKAYSYGRIEDGAADWEKFSEPTPGLSNTLFKNYAETLK